MSTPASVNDFGNGTIVDRDRQCTSEVLVGLSGGVAHLADSS